MEGHSRGSKAGAALGMGNSLKLRAWGLGPLCCSSCGTRPSPVPCKLFFSSLLRSQGRLRLAYGIAPVSPCGIHFVPTRHPPPGRAEYFGKCWECCSESQAAAGPGRLHWPPATPGVTAPRGQPPAASWGRGRVCKVTSPPLCPQHLQQGAD